MQINQASARMVVESFSFYQTGQSKLQKGPQQHVHVYASTHGSNYSLTYLSKSRAHFGFSWSIMNHCAWPMPAEDAPKGHYHFDIPGLRYFFQQMVKEPHDCAVGCRKWSIQGSESADTWQQTVTRRGTLHGANQHKTINGYVEYQGWEILGFLLPDSFVCTIHCALHTNPSRTSNEHTDTGIKQSSIPGKALVIYSRQLAGNMFHGQAFLHAILFCRDTHECTHNHS